MTILLPFPNHTFFFSQCSYVYTQHYCNCGSNSKFQVCKFLEVSKLSFSREYGPKLKEGYVMVKHLSKASGDDDVGCFPCQWFSCCSNKLRKVVEFPISGLNFPNYLLELKPYLLVFIQSKCTSFNAKKGPQVARHFYVPPGRF